MLQSARSLVNWDTVENVFLDMDGTLLDLHFDNYFWQEYIPLRYAECRGMSVAEARTELLPRFHAVEGTLRWYCADYWSSELGLDVLNLTNELQDSIRIHPGASELLEHTHAAGKRLVLLTNAHPGVLAIKLKHTGIGRYFDRVVSAHTLGNPKETPGFWRSLHALEPFECSRALFVDDSLPVLRAARADGLGQLVAVRRPDSHQPSRQIDGFPAVETLTELMPLKK